MKGSFFQSRRESNFYNGMTKERQLNYAKQWVANLNWKLLIPFIKITGATKYNREVFYEIDVERLLKVEEENKRLQSELDKAVEFANYKLNLASGLTKQLNDQMTENERLREALQRIKEEEETYLEGHETAVYKIASQSLAGEKNA